MRGDTVGEAVEEQVKPTTTRTEPRQQPCQRRTLHMWCEILRIRSDCLHSQRRPGCCSLVFCFCFDCNKIWKMHAMWKIEKQQQGRREWERKRLVERGRAIELNRSLSKSNKNRFIFIKTSKISLRSLALTLQPSRSLSLLSLFPSLSYTARTARSLVNNKCNENKNSAQRLSHRQK